MDPRTQAVLQQAFRRESLSMLRYVGEAYPWASAEGGAALYRLREIEAEDRAVTNGLGRFLFRRHVSPSFTGSFLVGFTTINFLSVEHLLPRLIASGRQAVADLARDVAAVSDPDAKAELQKLLAVKQEHLAELEGLKLPRRETTKVDVAALIDTHAHLDAEQFAADLPDVLERARAAGVVQIVAVATTASSSAACVALASQHPNVFATVGVHPNHAAEAAPTAWDEVVALADKSEVVGIGETGLDRHWHDTPFPIQEDYFARHLELSRRTNKPVVIHCREAELDVLRMLRADFDKNGPIHGVMHSFVGDAAMAEACLAMGLYLSFAGMFTYKNAQALREVAAKLPLDRLLVETDCPYLSPVPLRGKRNEPANVVHTAACLAGLHGVTPKALAERTTRNARALFGLPEPF